MKAYNLGGSVPQFIELRRKALKITQTEAANKMGLSLKTYRARVREERITVADLKMLGTLLDFNIYLIPTEAEVTRIT